MATIYAFENAAGRMIYGYSKTKMVSRARELSREIPSVVTVEEIVLNSNLSRLQLAAAILNQDNWGSPGRTVAALRKGKALKGWVT